MTVNSKLLPEWAPVRTVLLAWPHPKGDWAPMLDRAQGCYWGLLAALSAHTKVDVLLHPSINSDQWRNHNRAGLVNWSNINAHTINYDDTWVRDYGPLSTTSEYINCTFNGWGGKYSATLDNAVNSALFECCNTFDRGGENHRAALKTIDLTLEGGALETNGEVLLLNKDCVLTRTRNAGLTQEAIERIFLEVFGIEHCLWVSGIQLSGDDTDGHIDTIARFANRNTLLISGRNALHPDAHKLASLFRQVSDLVAANGWRVYELPSPVIYSELDGRVLPATYANFLIVNDCVFTPLYEINEDQEALRIFARVFSSYRLVPVNCKTLLEQHGSLHCATMQLAQLPVNLPIETY